MASCWICNAEADKWNIPHARLCGNCWARGVDGLRALDFGIVHGTAQTVEVEAPPPHAPRIQLVFRAESMGSLVKKLVKKELQLGHQHVDDQVYFQYADELDTPSLRSYEVSELIAELSKVAAVEIADSKALLHLADPNADKELCAMLAASLLHFISARQNLGRR